MNQGYDLWKELERSSREHLLHEIGLLYFGPKSSRAIESAFQSLNDLGVEFEVFGCAELSRQFPSMNFKTDEIGLFTPEAGWVAADRAVAATLKLAQAAGANIEIKSATQESLSEFDRVVVCPGAWIRDWWPDAPVRVTLQTTARIPQDVNGPVWIEQGDDYLYGIPGEVGEGFKVGVHRQGPEFDPNRTDRAPVPEFLDLIRDLAERRFGLRDTTLEDPTACLYTNTDTEDFLVHSLSERVLVISACSGHGFKFGPWIGRYVADIIGGDEDGKRYTRFLGR
jgi:glycine/D-amino acid oxidase-like deaminating enzyme